MNLRKLVAAGAAMALVAVGGYNVFAQDDLDDLLKDLEGTPAPGAPAAPAPVVAEPEPPVAEPEVPVVEPEVPVAEPEVPVAEPEVPVAEPEVPVAEPEAPVAVAEPETPVAEPVAEPEVPVAEPEAPVAVAEPDAPAVAEVPPATTPAKTDAELLDMLDELVSDVPVAPAPAAATAAPTVAVAEADGAAPAPAPAAETVAEAAPEAAPEVAGPDAELIANIAATQRLHRKAYDAQAAREIKEARECMRAGEYFDAARHYNTALRYLGDAAANEKWRIESRQGVAEGLYRSALQEDALGRRDVAIKRMKGALERRHPKARRQLAAWKDELDPEALRVDVSDIRGRHTDPEYVAKHTKVTKRLNRAMQLLGTKELDTALAECEAALVAEPQNQAAIRLREKIVRKIRTVAAQEHKAAREGMIADVERAWRPAYGLKSKLDSKSSSKTVKADLSNDPERTETQATIARMKSIVLPQFELRPPADLSNIQELFRQLSIDYGDKTLPEEQRQLGIMVWGSSGVRSVASAAPAEPADGFGAVEPETPQVTGPDVITRPVFLPRVSLYDALTDVLNQIDYGFTVKRNVVWLVKKGESIEEMRTQSFPVQKSFVDKMSDASADAKEQAASSSFGGGGQSAAPADDSKEADWKRFFTEIYGVSWPGKSSIRHFESLGRLFVHNTPENLAKLEMALEDMNAEPRLIEIEARFVEVCQEDLNSLGFEWILNSDYTLNLPKHLARALNIKNGAWGKAEGTTTISSGDSSSSSTVGGGLSSVGGTAVQSASTSVETVTTDNRTYYANSNGASWIRGTGTKRNAGVSGFGGNSDYTTGQRYLSTLSNHVSGEAKSTNDQFMRVNAFLGGADLSMILHMLSQRSDTDLLSAPKVLTKSGEQAVMKVVTEYRYPSDYNVQLQSSSSSGNSNGGSQSAILAVVEPEDFKMREVGVILDVTPTHNQELNIIDLQLDTQVVDQPTWHNYGMKIPFTGNASSLQNFQGIGDIFTGLSQILDSIGSGISDTLKATFAETAVGSATTALDNLTSKSSDNMTYYDAPMEQPFFHVRSIRSNVTVYPGATIVMGGLITEERKAMDDKIPFLGDLPFIGRLFRSHSEWTNKRNLLIFLTTRLVDPRGQDVTVVDLSGENGGKPVVPAPTAN